MRWASVTWTNIRVIYSMSDILISNFLNEYFFSFSPNQKRSCHVSSHVSIQVYSNINIFEGINKKLLSSIFFSSGHQKWKLKVWHPQSSSISVKNILENKTLKFFTWINYITFVQSTRIRFEKASNHESGEFLSYVSYLTCPTHAGKLSCLRNMSYM